MNRRIGLIAGWGRYPVVIAQALRAQGFDVFCLGIKDHADPVLADVCRGFRLIGLARLGTGIRYFRRHGVTSATMAGKIHKVLIFKKLYWLKHFPDLTFLKTFYPHFVTQTRDRKDDTILGTFVNVFGRHGVRFAPATDFVPEILVQYGQLAGRQLTNGQRRDIEFGWYLAREMGRLDVGQSVAVKGRAVLAVEAVEGTDECIRRAGSLCEAGGFTVVKVAKPQQDMRFDVPTIGMGTLRTMVSARARVLAVEAEKTIIIDQSQCVDFASRNGLSIVAIRNGNANLELPSLPAA